MPHPPPSLTERVEAALWGVLIADALSMPVHWYYDVRALRKDFGTITGYETPKPSHPSSIMPLSSTGGHGRGSQQGRIIGEVINHGKHKFWGVSGMHYHQGMAAGENTLNALCTRLVVRGMTQQGGYSTQKFLQDYVQFMTTPGSHNDTYAESFHRDFYSNWAKGVPPEKCSKGTEGHNTASIGGFVMLPPVILGTLPQGWPACKTATLSHLGLTHESAQLATYAELYAELLVGVAQGRDLRAAVLDTGSKLGVDIERVASSGRDDVSVVHGTFGSACYIDSSFPVVLFLAYKYAHSFEEAVLANTNVGGENCHRGAALGALMGVAHGTQGIPTRLLEGLHDYQAIRREIRDFVTALIPEQNDHSDL